MLGIVYVENIKKQCQIMAIIFFIGHKIYLIVKNNKLSKHLGSQVY